MEEKEGTGPAQANPTQGGNLREYSDEEISALAEMIIQKVKVAVRERVRAGDFDAIRIDDEIAKACDSVTDYGRAENWKWHSDADQEILDTYLDSQRVAERIYETKFEMLWRILREERYEPLFAEKIADSYDQELASSEEGMRNAVRKTAKQVELEEKVLDAEEYPNCEEEEVSETDE